MSVLNLSGDEADRASRFVEAERDASIDRARAMAAQPAPGSTGDCWHCCEPIPRPKRFCGPRCSDAWQRNR